MSKYNKRDQDKQLRLMEVSEDITSMHNKARNPARKQAINSALVDRDVLEDIKNANEGITLH